MQYNFNLETLQMELIQLKNRETNLKKINQSLMLALGTTKNSQNSLHQKFIYNKSNQLKALEEEVSALKMNLKKKQRQIQKLETQNTNLKQQNIRIHKQYNEMYTTYEKYKEVYDSQNNLIGHLKKSLLQQNELHNNLLLSSFKEKQISGSLQNTKSNSEMFKKSSNYISIEVKNNINNIQNNNFQNYSENTFENSQKINHPVLNSKKNSIYCNPTGREEEFDMKLASTLKKIINRRKMTIQI